jgi:AbrB family looped-hinge helix DNA binding protein
MMNAIVEIDKAGRIVIPKKMRDALHLKPGAQLKAEQDGERLTLTPSFREAQLLVENGAPLIIPADSQHAPVITTEMIDELISNERLQRERKFLGLDEASE